MAACTEGLTVRLGMNQGVSDLVQQLINPHAVVELVLQNCFVKEKEELLEQVGRCVGLRRLRCAACALTPSELFQVTAEHLPCLEDLELSLVQTFRATVDCEIENVRRMASRQADLIRSLRSVRRLYVEVGGDRNFKLLRKLLAFYPSLTELDIHVVRGGKFSKAVSQCQRLHTKLVKLESFTFSSELPVPFPYEPDLKSKFSILAAVCANVRHKKSGDSWSCFELRHIAITGRIILSPQVFVVAVMNYETEQVFRAASRRHLWTNVRQICLPLLPPMASEPLYPVVDGTYRDCLRDFFSVALQQVVELNLSSFHFGPDLDLMELLNEETLYRLQGFSAPPCAFRSQSAVRRVADSCPNLRDLDVRIERLQGHSRCDSCELLGKEETIQPPSNPGTLYTRCNRIPRLTLYDVPLGVLLWFLECYRAAVTLRLADWRVLEIRQYDRLCGFHGGNSAIRCLVLQHQHLPIDDEHLQASLSRMTSLRHLCLLTAVLVSDIDAVLYVRKIIARAAQLECLHIHYRVGGEFPEQRVTWLKVRGQAVFRRGPCFACCSTATFIGLVKPVNRDCETLHAE